MFGRTKPTSGSETETGPRNGSPGQDPVADFESLWEPSTAPARKSVEALLLERGHITEEQLDQALKVADQTPGKTLTQILMTMNAASEAQILSAVAETL